MSEASAAERVLWLHNKIKESCYPNAMRLSERFGISHRQAQRDVEYLRELGAMIEFVPVRRGYQYAEPFELPDDFCVEIPEDLGELFAAAGKQRSADSSMQIRVPYTAVIRIRSLLTVTELGSFIVERVPRSNLYRCEFANIGFFLGAILAADDDIRIVEPAWLRTRLIESLARLQKCNVEEEEQARKRREEEGD